MARGVGGEGGARGGRDKNAGAKAESKGGGTGNAGDRGTASQQQDRRNLETARRAGNAAPGVGANNNRGTLSQQQDRINTNRALARSNTAPGVGNYSKAMDDYNNVGQGFFDDPWGAIGRMLGGGIGIGEIDPSTQAPKSFVDRTTASWGIDPIGAALGIGGYALGPFGSLASTAYNRGIKALTGWQGPMIAFDGNQPVTGGFPSFGGGALNPGSPQPGGGTGMANGGNMGQPQTGGVLAPQTAQGPGTATPAPSGMGTPNFPQFSWAQPWPGMGGSQPAGGGPLSSWNLQQPQQQQPWSNGLMAPQQQSWTGWQ